MNRFSVLVFVVPNLFPPRWDISSSLKCFSFPTTSLQARNSKVFNVCNCLIVKNCSAGFYIRRLSNTRMSSRLEPSGIFLGMYAKQVRGAPLTVKLAYGVPRLRQH